MEQTTQGTWTTVATITVVVLAGVIVLLLHFPAGVLHSNPPQCLSTLGYRVPCGRLGIPAFKLAEWSLVASAMTAGAVGFALRMAGQLISSRLPSDPARRSARVAGAARRP